MKKLFLVCFCISISFIFSSCNNAKETNNSNSGTFVDKKTEISESMSERIENLEKEVNSLKDIINENGPMINCDAIINALDNTNGDNIFLSMENKKGYLNAIHVKVPKEENLSYRFYLLEGTDTDGVIKFNCIIKPQYDTSNNPEKIDVDLDKYEIYKLITSKLIYDETTALLIIIMDNKGNEYSQFIPSARFMGDI